MVHTANLMYMSCRPITKNVDGVTRAAHSRGSTAECEGGGEHCAAGR